MKQQHQSILKQLRRCIVDDVDVNNGILDALRENSILTNEDIAQIQSGETDQSKIEILLDIIPRCGPNAFVVFQNAIAYNYSWISEEMIKLNTDITVPYKKSISIPPISPLTVPREEKMEQLKTALTKLEPGGYVVLHGMKGFGKHSLTASTLKNESLVANLFDNQVYWIKFAYASSDKLIDTEILSQLNSLYHRVNNASMLSLVSESSLSKDSLIQHLKYHFSNNKNALVVLNDVWNPNIIDSFDFGCKTLVITTNVDLLGTNRIHEVVEMKDGFNETESLQLFADSLGIQSRDELPEEARSIHYDCNGMPLLIAMFAAQFQQYKDDMQVNNERWKYYSDALRQKDKSNKVISKFLDKQNAIFDMCIDQLTEPTKKMYKQLVIFSEDVNITAQTLQILWDVDKVCAVDDHMTEICKKSLAARQFNADLNAYIYGVHDLLLSHLQNGMEPDKLINNHKLFVEKYRKYCNNDFSKLPNDNYAYSYIGYHLEQAHMYDEFEKLYLDLNFIQSKIHYCGLNDLLIDINRYKNYIIADKQENRTKIEEWEIFLRSQSRIIAEHSRRNCLDLIQIGINDLSQGYIYNISRQLAQTRSTYLYLTHKPVEEPQSYLPPTDLCTANFTNEPTELLIGNKDGEVILWNIETHKRTTYNSHQKSKIIKVIVSKEDNFLALNNEGFIEKFIFEIDNNEINNSERYGIQSPREKQSYWSGIYRNPKPSNVKTYMIQDNNCIHIIQDFALSSDDTTISACTSRGIITVWNMNGDIIFTDRDNKRYYKCITFSNKSEILCMLDRAGIIYVYRKNYTNDDYIYKTSYRPNILNNGDSKSVDIDNKKFIYFNEIQSHEDTLLRLLIITNSEALTIQFSKIINNNGEISNPCTRVVADIDNKTNPNMKYIAGTMTHDGNYFIIGDTEGFVKVWKILGASNKPCITFFGRINLLDTYYYIDESYHLIIGASNQIIYKWSFLTDKDVVLKSPIKPLFDAIMKPYGQSDIVAQVTDKKISIHIGQKTIQTEPIIGEIISLSLSHDGSNILYIVKQTIIFDIIYKIFIYDGQKNNEIKSFSEYVGFAKFLRIHDMNVAVWRQGNDLGIKLSTIESQAKNTGHVIALHTIGVTDDKYVITVASNKKIMIWKVSDVNYALWQVINTIIPTSNDETVTYSEINQNQDLLAVLSSNITSNLNGILNIYMISKKENDLEMNLQITCNFKEKLTCCSFSPVAKYLAIGVDNGEIIIFELLSQNIYKDPPLHCNAIRQLCWAPLYVEQPILLSLTCDEMAWWNVSFMRDIKQSNRRSRHGPLSRSVTTPTMGMSPRSSMRLPKSHTTDLSKLTIQLEKLENNDDDNNNINNNNNNNNDNLSEFWKSKQPRDSKRSLLGLTQLPQSSLAKVCVSSDF